MINPLSHLAAEPPSAPGHDSMPVANRAGSDTVTGSNKRLRWGSRSDVGLVRGHNEDAFLVDAPLFCVCDGMGGQAAGEVASAIAIETIAAHAPLHADDTLLGACIEAANDAIIERGALGEGSPGMGCTASAVLIEDDKMAIGHVGDSRIYLLRAGTLVRATHDHSFVEELVDAGEITPEEARVHPSRSVITRALGNDPEMYADHFLLDAETGDRIIVCSDGLSGMITDAEIEAIAVSSATPQGAADNLVSAALTEGGHDNVTVIVIDVVSDGVAEKRRRAIGRRAAIWAGALAFILVLLLGIGYAVVQNSWYVADNNGTVAIYHGINGEFLGFGLSDLTVATNIRVSDLPEATQQSLAAGISMGSEEQARETIDSYRAQIQEAQAQAAQVAAEAQAQSGTEGAESGVTPSDAVASPEPEPTNTAQEPAPAQGVTDDEAGRDHG